MNSWSAISSPPTTTARIRERIGGDPLRAPQETHPEREPRALSQAQVEGLVCVVAACATLRSNAPYDHIGNRLTYGLDANPDTRYTANDLTQYSGTTSPSEAFAHDLDGNLSQDGTFNYTWDGENRLKAVTPRGDAGVNS